MASIIGIKPAVTGDTLYFHIINSFLIYFYRCRSNNQTKVDLIPGDTSDITNPSIASLTTTSNITCSDYITAIDASFNAISLDGAKLQSTLNAIGAHIATKQAVDNIKITNKIIAIGRKIVIMK